MKSKEYFMYGYLGEGYTQRFSWILYNKTFYDLCSLKKHLKSLEMAPSKILVWVFLSSSICKNTFTGIPIKASNKFIHQTVYNKWLWFRFDSISVPILNHKFDHCRPLLWLSTQPTKGSVAQNISVCRIQSKSASHNRAVSFRIMTLANTLKHTFAHMKCNPICKQFHIISLI